MKKNVIYSRSFLSPTQAGQSGAGIASKLLAWDSVVNGVPLPIEVGRFKDRMFRNPSRVFPNFIRANLQKETESILVLSWRQLRAGQSGAGIASKLPAWDSDISSVPVPVEVGRFQDSLFGNPLVFFCNFRSHNVV